MHPAVWPQQTIDMGRKLGAAVPFLAELGSQSHLTAWPGTRPTSVPSGILIHSAVWPQRIGKKGAAVPRWGELGPHLTQCRLGRDLPPYQQRSDIS